MKRYLFVLLAMAAVIAAPMILRPRESARTADYAAGDRLVITAGVPFGTPGATNILRIAWVE